MNFLREQYFPLLHPFYHRVKRWRKERFSSAPECRIIKGAPVSVVEYTLPENPLLPEGKKIAFLSDLHFHEKNKFRRIAAHTVELLEKYAPDYLFFGGDMCGDADEVKLLNEIMEPLCRCAGVCLATGGNWEYGKGWFPEGFWENFYAKYGVRYLANAQYCDENFAVSGVMDISTGRSRLPAPVPERFNILLAHSPDTAVALERGDLPVFPQLVLCGHTHGGQVNIPFLNRPLHIHSRYGNFFAHGVYRHQRRDSVMLVSAGLGELSFPLRFNCPRELLFVRTGERSKI